MKGRSILLALNGSQQSWFASELCWSLAKQLGVEIQAQHVVDSHSAWSFIGHDKQAFLETDKYLSAYQRLCLSLFDLGEELATAYNAAASTHGQFPPCVVDEGNPIVEICRRAVEHDLVVIGHRPTALSGDLNPRSQFLRLSVAEALSHDCPRPLLVVQEQARAWKNITITISTEHINERFINSCLDLANALQLTSTLLCLAGAPNVNQTEFIQTLRRANSRLEAVPITFIQDISEDENDEILKWGFSEDDKTSITAGHTLMVVPTREISGQRTTVLGGAASSFVRYLTLPSMLLWPEEYVFSFGAANERSTAAIV